MFSQESIYKFKGKVYIGLEVPSYVMYLLGNNTVHYDREGVQIEVEVEPSAIPTPVVAHQLIDKPIPGTVAPSAILSSDAPLLIDKPMPLGRRSIDASPKICTIPEQQHL